MTDAHAAVFPASPATGDGQMLPAHGPGPATLAEADLALIDAYWRAANYLSVGQIYLIDCEYESVAPGRAWPI